MSINPSHDNFKHIEFLPGNKQIKYKPASSFDSLSNLFNIRAIFSSIRAMLASFFGPSNAATEIRHNFKVINEPKGVDKGIIYSATKLLSSLRSQPPADVSLSEAQRLRADSALALFNMGFFSTIVENYADWQTEGSAKEGEVWRTAYDQLLSNNLHDLDPDIGALLRSKVDARYSGSEKIKHKIDIGKALLTSNYKKALKSLKKAIEDESNPATKRRFEKALQKLEEAFISYKNLERDFTNYDAVTNAWFQLNLAVEDIPKVYDLMSKGYTEPTTTK